MWMPQGTSQLNSAHLLTRGGEEGSRSSSRSGRGPPSTECSQLSPKHLEPTQTSNTGPTAHQLRASSPWASRPAGWPQGCYQLAPGYGAEHHIQVLAARPDHNDRYTAPAPPGEQSSTASGKLSFPA